MQTLYNNYSSLQRCRATMPTFGYSSIISPADFQRCRKSLRRLFAVDTCEMRLIRTAPRPMAVNTRSVQGAAISVSAAETNATSNADAHYNVAIIGGGPAGLLAAKAMLTVVPWANIKVFEAASTYQQNVGAGVTVDINGWRAVHAVDGDLADRLAARGLLFNTSLFFNEKGDPLDLQPKPFDHEATIRAHGHTAVLLHWGDIRQTLCEAVPPGIMAFSSRVVGLTPGRPGSEPAVLDVQGSGGGDDGGEPALTSRVTADLVIVADGYYSRSKRMSFGASGPPLMPTFRGRVVWRALVAYKDKDQIPEVLRKPGSDTRVLWWMADGQPPERIAVVYPVKGNHFAWTCIGPVTDIEAAGLGPWSPQSSATQDARYSGRTQIGSVGVDAKARCLGVFRNYPPEVLDLLHRTDPSLIVEHGYYTHDMQDMQGAPDWVRGNVVAVGDAAHTGPPDGMGLNMAWEDVAVLAAEIKRVGGKLVSSEALQAYCDARIARVREIWSETDIVKPRRQAAKEAAAFEPLGDGSSGRHRTAPPLK